MLTTFAKLYCYIWTVHHKLNFMTASFTTYDENVLKNNSSVLFQIFSRKSEQKIRHQLYYSTVFSGKEPRCRPAGNTNLRSMRVTATARWWRRRWWALPVMLGGAIFITGLNIYERVFSRNGGQKKHRARIFKRL